jgi:hypothetical protein
MRSKLKRLHRLLLIPDCHVPYEDKKAFELMLRGGRSFEPDTVIVGGDFGDCYPISSHSKDPRRRSDLEYEVHRIRERLAQVAALAPNRVFLEGNHENRLERYLMDKAPELFGLIKIPELFHIHKLGFHFVPYKTSFRFGKVWFTHDLGKAGQNAHRAAAADYRSSCVINHTHRMEMSVQGCVEGPPSVAAMFGWLGDFNSVDYMHKAKAKRDWVHGFGVGYMESNGVVHLQPVPIVHGRCVVGGKLIT